MALIPYPELEQLDRKLKELLFVTCSEVRGLSERERALVRFVRKVARDPRSITESDIGALKAQGVANTLALTFNFDEDLERFGMRNDYF